MSREMKESGVEWIGEIPEDWDLIRIQSQLHEVNEKNSPIKVQQILSLTNIRGVIPYKDKGNLGNRAKENLEDYKIAYPGTIVANSMNILIGSVGYCGYLGCVSPVYYVFAPAKAANIKFMNYFMSMTAFQKELRRNANGILEIRMRVTVADILKKKMAIPSPTAQQQIVHFLDCKCTAIDTAIEKTKKSIVKLEEYKKAVITKAVTKGINPNAKMKDSGVEWIGEIPEGWDIRRGKFIFKKLSRSVKDSDEVITCFRDGEVTLRKNRREEGFTFSDKEIGYQGIEPGDLVVHGMDGFAGSIGISDSRGKATPVLNVLSLSENKKYYMYYLRSMAYGDVFTAIATGIRVRSCNLNWNKLAELSYPVPDKDIQKQIVNYIDNIIEATNDLIKKKQIIINKWEEYKKSLIYYAVTGKIDCRNEVIE